MKQLAFFLLLAGLTPSVWAASSALAIPAMFQLLYENGNKTSIAFYGREPLPLQPGEQQVVLQYRQAFDSEIDGSYQSSPIVLHFVVKAGQQILIEAKRPRTKKEAKVYAKSPKLKLIDRITRSEIPTKITITERLGWQNGPNIELLNELKKAQTINIRRSRLDELQKLYSSADDSTQAAFKAWLAQSD